MRLRVIKLEIRPSINKKVDISNPLQNFIPFQDHATQKQELHHSGRSFLVSARNQICQSMNRWVTYSDIANTVWYSDFHHNLLVYTVKSWMPRLWYRPCMSRKILYLRMKVQVNDPTMRTNGHKVVKHLSNVRIENGVEESFGEMENSVQGSRDRWNEAHSNSRPSTL